MTRAATNPVAAAPLSVSLELGPYKALIGTTPDLRAYALALRADVFLQGRDDTDRFDDTCLHGCVLSGTGAVQVAFRARLLHDPRAMSDSYTGQNYDLSPLRAVQGPFLELGRFCQADGRTDTTALRLAWAAIGVLVDQEDVRMMIGCSSFPKADPATHHAPLAVLRARHLGPSALRPGRRSKHAIDLPKGPAPHATLPPLLRSYLGMGGWVGDHAVLDRDLDRLHVFTGLSIEAIPEPRKARLRAVAQAAETAGS
ncbi:GNAT family N-acyltransferase [Marivita sp. XM-24bin2]|uniref:GNAT family N-acyltransferase n=1 Tax=Marivita sp. XM-24bin2 TaxID=2133951 RepID=UPI000D7A0024|nr:GNAT family N-acyltransferase [Marivita sp. XM-24bin2]PWL34616.1 MAG: ornithine-acyl-ACP acyltransferase [Marivita sp. XM-24bin2]